MRNGMLPGCRPDIHVGCPSEAASRATSAPEFPAPTTRTPPSRSCDGLKYWLEWSCTILGSSSAAKSGTLGIW